MTKRLALAMLFVASAATASFAQLEPVPAKPEQLNGQHHALRFELTNFESADDALGWIGVGAQYGISVPQTLGAGHGPFYTVFPEGAKLVAHAPAGVTLSAITDGGFQVRCDRAGVFPIDVTMTPKHGAAIHDTTSIGCAKPTRFEVDGPQGTLLAGASTISVSFTWYGTTPAGVETQLGGTYPVSLRAGETAISLDLAHETVHALHATSAVVLVSEGLEATLPVDIVDAKATVDLGFNDNFGHPAVDHSTLSRVWPNIRVLDEHGQPFLGVASGCELTSTLDGVTTERGERCNLPIIRKGHLHDRQYPEGERMADSVCVTMLGQTVCKVIP